MHVETSSDIGALIRERRSRLGWSQAELASRVGVSRLWIVQLEKGKSTAHIGLVLRALKALGIEMDMASSRVVPSRPAKTTRVNLNSIIRNSLSPQKP